MERPETVTPATPETLRDDIIELTNETFDRITPRLQPFVNDERRARGRDGSGTTLTSDNENVLWEHGQYGDFRMFVGRSVAQQEVYSAFALSPVVQRFAGPFGEARTHEKLVRESKRYPYYDKTRFEAVGAVLLLHVVRDRFPSGDADYRESLMAPRRNPEEVPADEWGERHGIGVELVTKYEDRSVPERGATWRLGLDMQTRFDRDGPQSKLTSRFEGLVDTHSLGYGETFEEKITSIRRPDSASVHDLTASYRTLQRCFAAAKDLRPWVTPIRQQLRSQAAFHALIAESGFFSGDTASDS